MSLLVLFGLFLSHFIGDFILQSDRVALGKSKSWLVLLEHVFLYSVCFVWAGREFVLVTFLLHYATDAVTSRQTSRLWFIDMLSEPDREIAGGAFVGKFNDNRHYFFVMIGLDQLIHYITLVTTWHFLN